eukprot:15434461-Alexandrium_andersonii.AAC.1
MNASSGSFESAVQMFRPVSGSAPWPSLRSGFTGLSCRLLSASRASCHPRLSWPGQSRGLQFGVSLHGERTSAPLRVGRRGASDSVGSLLVKCHASPAGA